MSFIGLWFGKPGGDKLPRQLVGGAMSRSRGVGAAFDCRLGLTEKRYSVRFVLILPLPERCKRYLWIAA
jgi:hypothetical protein